MTRLIHALSQPVWQKHIRISLAVSLGITLTAIPLISQNILTAAKEPSAQTISQSQPSVSASEQQTAPGAEAKLSTSAQQSGDILEYSLPTGQKLYIKPDHTKPIVTIDTWVKTGSVNETKDINGVSHFLEHVLFKGTPTHLAGVIERVLESKGAEFNAATSDDYTHYYITTATPYFEEALNLHSDMLLNANLPPAELNRERAVVQEEINRATDNPQRQLYIALSKLVYGNHGYGLDTLGLKENIANIPRESILDYYHYWYQPQNFATVIVGDVEPAQVKALVEKYFIAPTYQSPKAYTAPSIEQVPGITANKGQMLSDPNIAHAFYSLSFLGPSIQQAHDSYALDIAMNVLGDGKSSRLYRRLVEKEPLAIDVGAMNMTQRYSGLLNINAQSKPENRAVVKQILLEELQNLLEKGITPEELSKAKTQVLKDYVFLNETSDGVAQSIGYNVTIGTLKDYTDYVAEIQKITAEDVKKAAATYLNFNQAVVVEMVPDQLKANLATENTANLSLLAKTAESIALASQPVENLKAVTASDMDQATNTNQSKTADQPPQVSKATLDLQKDKLNATVQRLMLPNGMAVLLKQNTDSNTVALKLFVKGGQLRESVPGVATLAAQLMLQGTQSRSAEAISEELESKGMNLHAVASEDFLEISGDAMKDDLGELFMILQDALHHAEFKDSELAKQKELLKQSILASRNNPSSIAFENLSLTMYPDHPYGNVGKRIEQNLRLVERQNILQFTEANLKPENTLAVVVGNFDPVTVKNYLNALYPSSPETRGQIGNGAETQAVTPAIATKNIIDEVKALRQSEEVLESKDKQAATWIAKGWLVPSISNADHVPLKVLNSLLGSGMSSRLFVNLRERQGLAYVVSSFYPTREQKSRFVLYIGTDPKNFSQVEKGFAKEIERLKNEPVTAKELQDAKDKLAGNFALAHETNANQAYYLGLFETLGVGYQFDASYPGLIQQVRPADIQRVAKKYFSQPSVTSVVKPKDVSNQQKSHSKS